MGKKNGSSSWCAFFSVHCYVFMLFMNVPLCSSSAHSQTLCRDNERSALLQFKASFTIDKSASQDPLAYPKIASWGSLYQDRRNFCLSDGVECRSNNSGHVVGLDLARSYLHGSINSSSSLFRLVHSQRLDLLDNNFSFSRIPSRLGHVLTSLTYLNLSMSSFSGQVPSEISYISKLSSLDLSTTFESHLKMAHFGRLVQNLTNIKQLHLGWVELGSIVSTTLVNVTFLTSLVLRACNLQGQLPLGIFDLPNLQVLDLYYNENLKGYLPDTFNQSSPLKILNIFNTYFSGHLPASLGNLGHLNVFDLAYFLFDPHVPSSLGNLTHLSFLDLSYFLDPSNFSGQVTDSWSWMGKLTKLNSLLLRSNNLRGEFPSFLDSLTQLEELDLSENQLTSEIPFSLASMTHLSRLYLLLNQITGELPSCLACLTQLSELHLGYNRITGRIPSYLGEFTLLTSLDIPSNKFEGRIPSAIGNLRRLRWLNVFNNTLSGVIPPSLGNLTALRSLDLSEKKLSGTIPGDLAQLTFLTYFNVSYNGLHGLIPQGQQFDTFQQDSYQGNLGLCGKHLSKKC